MRTKIFGTLLAIPLVITAILGLDSIFGSYPAQKYGPDHLDASGARYLDKTRPVDPMAIAGASTDGTAFQRSHPVSFAYVASPATLADGDQDVAHMDSKRGLFVAGTVANDGVDGGYPVKIGAIARNTWETAVGAADRVNLSADLYGRLRVIAGRESTTWSTKHTPAANTQATISKAAGAAGVKHVCTGYAWSLSSGAGAPTPELITIAIRDGATGAGTIIWEETVSLPAVAGSSARGGMTGMYLVGTAATAMTIETDSAPGANVVASVSIMGEDISN